MTVPFTSDTDSRQLRGADANHRDSRRSKLSDALDIQDVLRRDLLDPITTPDVKASLARAWDVIEERIRILRGRTKAGSRNISVRELSKEEREERAAKARGTGPISVFAVPEKEEGKDGETQAAGS